ncbi:hypothetical protein ACO0LO_05925 [Undibacterium sp. TJN25]|uniref:hypothetical protein n=1 Tax=Undibacterium sp. TJN25 TaxID=3413056 RepID=UPI003BF1FEAE
MAYAKISVPRFRGILQRSRIFSILDQMSDAGGIWVSSPPGGGKTSLVGSYLEADDRPVLWYHLDRSDRDPASFFSCFDDALAQLCERGLGAFCKFTSGQILDFPLFCSSYLREAYEYLPARCAIVLDDYHQAEGGALEHFVKAAIAEAPADARVFITSRTPPPSFLARERANRRLGVIDWDVLKFDTEEISALCLAAGVQVNGDLLNQLTQKTQGWAAGLILLLERAKAGNPAGWSLAPGHSPETIFNYFAEEIFALESAKTQGVLISLVFLPQYTRQVAAYMADDPAAAEIVDDLYSRNFFTDKRSGATETYQFHSLFREFLQRKARSMLSPGELSQLQRKSAIALEGAGDFDTAIELYRLLEDFSGITHIVSTQAERLFSAGLEETVSRWMLQLPFEWIAKSPVLQYWSAKAEIFSNPQHARRLMEQAYQGFTAATDFRHQIAAVSGILRCYVTEARDFKGAEAWGECLENLLGRYGAELPVPLKAEAVCSLLCVLSPAQPQRPSLDGHAEQLSSMLHEELAPDLKNAIAGCLLDHYAWRGQFSICEELLAHVRALPIFPETAVGLAWLGIAKLHYFVSVANYPDARAEFESLSRAIPNTRQFFLSASVYVSHVQACLVAGCLQEADALIEKLGQMVEPRRSMDLMMTHFVKSWRSLLYGDLAKAKAEAERMLVLQKESGAGRSHALGLVALATINVLAGEYDAVADMLNEGRSLFPGMANPLLDFHLRLLEAYLQLHTGQRAACHQSLEAAFSLARREALRNTVFWVPALVAPLCAEALDAGIETEYVAQLIRGRQLFPPAGSYMPGWPWPVEIRALGSFEIRIGGELLQFTHKAQRKPLELLKLLIAQGGRNVSAEKTADVLWPDSDGDAAQSSFDSTLHRLRKLLRHDDVVMLSEGRLSLNHSLCWLDIWALDRLAEEVSASPSIKKLSAHAAQLFHIYRGPLFSADADLPGQSQASNGHRSKFERCLMDLCSIFQSMGKMGLAIELLEQGLENDAEVKLLPMLLRDLKKQLR